MNLLSQLTIKARLIFLVCFAALLMLSISGLGFYAMNSAVASLQSVYTERLVPSGQISRIMDLMQENRSQLLFALQHEEGSKTAPFHKHEVAVHTNRVASNIEEITEIWKTYMSRDLSPEEMALAEEFAAKRAVYVNEGLKPAAQYIDSAQFLEGALHLAKKTKATFDDAHDAAEKIWQLQLSDAEAAFHDAEQRDAVIANISLAAVVVGTTLLSMLAFVTIRGIAGGVDGLNVAAERLAGGTSPCAVHTGLETSWVGWPRVSTRWQSSSARW